MNLVFVGCEYAGKSTIAAEVMEWAERLLEKTSHFHDHFSVPSSELSPNTVLVLFKANAEVIARRMREVPHTHQVVQEKDIANVLERFEEEVEASLIQKRIVLDTSSSTVTETMAEFVENYEPFFSNADLLRRRQRH